MKLIYAEKFASGIALMEMSFLESGDGNGIQERCYSHNGGNKEVIRRSAGRLRRRCGCAAVKRPKHIVKTCRMDKSL